MGFYLDLGNAADKLDEAFRQVYGKNLSKKLKEGNTVGELRSYLDNDKLIQVLAALDLDVNETMFKAMLAEIANMPGTDLDNASVFLDTPEGQAGSYTVIAAAVARNTLPGTAKGQLIIKDVEETLTYAAQTGGQVKLQDYAAYAGIATETVLSQGQTTGAIAQAEEGYHFVHWIDADSEVVSNDANFVPANADNRYTDMIYTAVFEKHNFTNYVFNNDATCTVYYGTKTAKCVNCETTDTIINEGSKLAHTEVIDKAVAATCWLDYWRWRRQIPSQRQDNLRRGCCHIQSYFEQSKW